eukprot:6585400-Pyramimonas_sp.AAC.1
MRTHGRSLWVQTKLLHPFQHVFANPRQVAVCLVSPTRMFATIQTDRHKINVFILHAPHSRRPPAEIDRWWADTNRLYKKHLQPDAMPIVLCDANAAVGSQQSKAIGP